MSEKRKLDEQKGVKKIVTKRRKISPQEYQRKIALLVEQLPPEILSHIASFVSDRLSELQNLICVCKKWKSAIQQGLEKLHLTPPFLAYFSIYNQNMFCLFQTLRNFSNIQILKLNLFGDYFQSYINVISMCTRLCSLTFDFEGVMNKKGWQSLATLTNLTHLDFNYEMNEDNSEPFALSKLTRLKVLSLDFDATKSKKWLSRLTNLESLTVIHRFNPSVLESLPKLTSLTIKYTFQLPKPFPQLTNLLSLTFFRPMYSLSISRLTPLSNLTALCLSYESGGWFKTPNAYLSFLSAFPRLKKLKIGNISYSNNTYPIRTLTSLEYLSMSLDNILLESLPYFPSLTKLELLVFDDENPSNVAEKLNRLSHATKLRKFKFYSVYDDLFSKLDALSTVANLQTLLICQQPSVHSDETSLVNLKFLSQFTQLNSLILQMFDVISFESVKYLTNLTFLELNAKGDDIEKGLKEVCSRVTTLQHVKVSVSSITEQMLLSLCTLPRLHTVFLHSEKTPMTVDREWIFKHFSRCGRVEILSK